MRKLSILFSILILVVSMGCRKEMTMAEKNEKSHEVTRLSLLSSEGKYLTPEEVIELENKTKNNPEDIESRARLITYYFFNKFETEEYPKYIPHVKWIVKNAPGHILAGDDIIVSKAVLPKEYEEVKALWLENLKGRPSKEIILNAASFFTISDSKTALEIVQKNERRFSKDPEYLEKLGYLYRFTARTISGEEKTQMYEKSFRTYEKAYDLCDSDMERMFLLEPLAAMSFNIRELNKSQKYAQMMVDAAARDDPLARVWPYNCRIYHNGNQLLGIIELEKGNIETAIGYLHKSSKLDNLGEPRGLKFHLAYQLIFKDQIEEVEKYLIEMKKYVPENKKSLIDSWLKEINDGKIPDMRL